MFVAALDHRVAHHVEGSNAMHHDRESSQMLRFTEHSKLRIVQRGVQAKIFGFLYREHDLEVDCGNGCSMLMISHERLERLAAAGVPAQLLDRLAGLCMILSSDNALVTVMHLRGKAGKSRERKHWWRKRDWRWQNG
ncbi:MAG: hypothetical protein ACK4TG_05675 [Thermaurantiacus sp.]